MTQTPWNTSGLPEALISSLARHLLGFPAFSKSLLSSPEPGLGMTHREPCGLLPPPAFPEKFPAVVGAQESCKQGFLGIQSWTF